MSHARNVEFAELFKLSRWSQAEVARRLKKSDGAISRFRSGDIIPTEAVMDLFRRVLKEEFPADMEAWERGKRICTTREETEKDSGCLREVHSEYHAKLQALPEDSRKVVHGMIDLLLGDKISFASREVRYKNRDAVRHAASNAEQKAPRDQPAPKSPTPSFQPPPRTPHPTGRISSNEDTP